MAQAYERLLMCEYLVEAYDEANRGWRDFQTTGRQRELAGAAEPLCTALGALQEDGNFWAAVYDLREGAKGHWEEVRVALSNLERLLALEEDVLEKRFGDKRARQLVSDLSLALGMVRADRKAGPPSPQAIENLRARLRPLTEDTCAVAWDARDGDKGIYGAVLIAGRAMLVVGGASLVVVNATAWGALGVPDVLGSATGGLSLMLAQFPEAEQRAAEERAGT